MYREHFSHCLATGVLLLSFGTAALASDSEDTKITVHGAPAASETTTTTTSTDPVVIHDDLGNTTVMPGDTRTVQTRTGSDSVRKETIVQKKKKASHHLLNVFGLKVL
ncbi:MAG: hypothetical protein K2X81_29360 [Candidatus Obscuribacterales bacterium]|nr:hypothetical protein [Candidatus Obscuribacterales bacterium]